MLYWSPLVAVCLLVPLPAVLVCVLVVSDIKSPTMNNYLTALEASGWLKHIKSVLETSVFIAKVSYTSSVSLKFQSS